MTRSHYNARLHWFALATAAVTLLLLGAGGMVTSHEAGLAVPDWPTSYGYNMFLFPVSKWVGGILYEHTHRLLASGVGLLTSVLALWLYGRNSRPLLRWGGVGLVLGAVATATVAWRRLDDAVLLGGVGMAALAVSFAWPRCEASPRWLRRLGVAAFLAVVLQGVLGGLRVTLLKDQIGIFHATLAQLFFALTCALGLFTSRWWIESAERGGAGFVRVPAGLRRWFVTATALIFAQLVLGATMRHQHAGLAIPDFPLAYGRLWPAMDAASVEHYNAQRMEDTSVNSITAFQIGLQMAHRILAVVILLAVARCAWLAWRRLDRRDPLFRLAAGWLGLILAQATLGAATVLSNKAADIATAHVLVGALSLGAGAFLCILSCRRGASAEEPGALPAGVEADGRRAFAAGTA